MRDSRSTGMVAVVNLSIALMMAGAFSPMLSQARINTIESTQGQDILKCVEDLAKEGRKENAAKTIRGTYGGLVERLIEVAKQPGKALPVPEGRVPIYPWHEPKHLAILLLGDLRASAAVPALLENLEYMNSRDLYHGMLDRGGQYPAVEALCKIGMPAVDPTTQKLSAADPKSRSAELCCWILRDILGVKLARARIQIAVEEAQNETAKANLKAALPYFRTPEEKAEEERAKAEAAKRGQK